MCRPTKRPKPASQFESPVAPATLESSFDFKQHFGAEKEHDFEIPTTIVKAADEMEQKSMVAPLPPASKQTFVFTTYEMVSDEANAQAVGFDSTGTLIQIRDATTFGEQVLPKYFRHRNVTSFYRQLNSYGFRTIKTSSVEVSHTFICDLFRRDRPDLLPSIVRKKAAPPPPALAAAQQQFKQRAAAAAAAAVATAANNSSSCNIVPSAPVQSKSDDASVMRMIHELKEFQRNQQVRALQLEENIRRLSNENSRILREGEQVISSMQGMVMNQKNVIHRLFGSKASDAFEAQLKSDTFLPVETTSAPLAAPASPFSDMDLFSLDASSAAAGTMGSSSSPVTSFEEAKFVLPDDDLLELETLLAFEEDGFSF